MEAIFTIERNVDYNFGDNWLTFHFFHKEDDINAYIEHMKCWSGYISVIEKIPIKEFKNKIEEIFTKYKFSEDAKNTAIKLYKEFNMEG